MRARERERESERARERKRKRAKACVIERDKEMNALWGVNDPCVLF